MGKEAQVVEKKAMFLVKFRNETKKPLGTVRVVTNIYRPRFVDHGLEANLAVPVLTSKDFL